MLNYVATYLFALFSDPNFIPSFSNASSDPSSQFYCAPGATYLIEYDTSLKPMFISCPTNIDTFWLLPLKLQKLTTFPEGGKFIGKVTLSLLGTDVPNLTYDCPVCNVPVISLSKFSNHEENFPMFVTAYVNNMRSIFNNCSSDPTSNFYCAPTNQNVLIQYDLNGLNGNNPLFVSTITDNDVNRLNHASVTDLGSQQPIFTSSTIFIGKITLTD
jgi:hypothetical protein